MTFHNEAEWNVEINGTLVPHSQQHYMKLWSNLQRLSIQPNADCQLTMLLTGAGSFGKTEIINSVLAYAKGFCLQMQYVFDK